jgi:hypothetical protein
MARMDMTMGTAMAMTRMMATRTIISAASR